MKKWTKLKRDIYRNRHIYIIFLPVFIYFFVFKVRCMAVLLPSWTTNR